MRITREAMRRNDADGDVRAALTASKWLKKHYTRTYHIYIYTYA